MIDRVGYSDIKANLLACYWRGCRDHGLSGWSHEQVCAWAYGEFDGAYDFPVEIIMLEVASLILTGGWSSKLVAYHKDQILRILDGVTYEAFLDGLPAEEVGEVKADLLVANII